MITTFFLGRDRTDLVFDVYNIIGLVSSLAKGIIHPSIHPCALTCLMFVSFISFASLEKN